MKNILRSHWLGSVALAGATSLLFAAPAYAQDAAQPTADQAGATGNRSNTGLEDIVVTATRQATNLQRTPIAITAVTAQGLEQRSFTSIADVAAIVPNASFTNANAAYGRAVQAYIRGIGQYDFNLAFEPGVSFYVDDQYYALLAGSTFDLLDLERVEVLRGPQGTVFGRNAIGGAVNLIPKAPGPNPEGYIEATYGAYNRQDIRAGFNVPLTDNLFLRVSGVSKNRRGYQKLLDFRCDMIRKGTPGLAGNFPSLDSSGGFTSGKAEDGCVIGRYGGEDVQALRGAIRYKGSRLDVTLTADYTNDDSVVAADKQLQIIPNAQTKRLDELVYQPLWGISYDERFLTDSPFTTYATYADPIPAGSVYPAGCNLPGSGVACTYYNGSGDRGGINLDRKAVIRNYGFSGKAIYDIDDNLKFTLLGGYRHVFTTGINDTDGSPLSIQTVKTQIRFHQFTAEPRLNYTSDLFDATLGAFYYNSSALTTSNVSIAFLSFQQNARISFDNESKAVYGQVVIRPIDKLSVTIGGRYSKDTKDVLFNNGQGGIIRNVNVKGHHFDYRLGLDYRLQDNITVYGSIATGYRPGAFNPRPFQASQLVPVSGEALTAYEIGFKGDLLDRHLRLNLAAFYSDYSRRIVPQGGSECLNDGTTGHCTVPGPQFDQSFLGTGLTSCIDATPEQLANPDLAAGVGVTCISKTNYVNSPGKVKGLEAEIEARPIEGLLINLSGGYTKFDAPDLKNNPAVVNKDPVFVPEWTGSAGIAYDIDMRPLGGKVTPRLDALYQSSLAFNSTSAVARVPGRTVFNGRITYTNDDNDWMVAVGATNLFNKRYYYNIFDLTAFGQPTTEGQPGRPREWYLTVKKSF